jgi:hypothetical protein
LFYIISRFSAGSDDCVPRLGCDDHHHDDHGDHIKCCRCVNGSGGVVFSFGAASTSAAAAAAVARAQAVSMAETEFSFRELLGKEKGGKCLLPGWQGSRRASTSALMVWRFIHCALLASLAPYNLPKAVEPLSYLSAFFTDLRHGRYCGRYVPGAEVAILLETGRETRETSWKRKEKRQVQFWLSLLIQAFTLD